MNKFEVGQTVRLTERGNTKDEFVGHELTILERLPNLEAVGRHREAQLQEQGIDETMPPVIVLAMVNNVPPEEIGRPFYRFDLDGNEDWTEEYRLEATD